MNPLNVRASRPPAIDFSSASATAVKRSESTCNAFLKNRQAHGHEQDHHDNEKIASELVHGTRTKDDDGQQRRDNHQHRQKNRAAAGNADRHHQREAPAEEKPVAINAAGQGAVKQKGGGERRIKNHARDKRKGSRRPDFSATRRDLLASRRDRRCG